VRFDAVADDVAEAADVMHHIGDVRHVYVQPMGEEVGEHGVRFCLHEERHLEKARARARERRVQRQRLDGKTFGTVDDDVFGRCPTNIRFRLLLERVARCRAGRRFWFWQRLIPPELCNAVPRMFAVGIGVEQRRDVTARVQTSGRRRIVLRLDHDRHVIREPMHDEFFARHSAAAFDQIQHLRAGRRAWGFCVLRFATFVPPAIRVIAYSPAGHCATTSGR